MDAKANSGAPGDKPKLVEQPDPIVDHSEASNLKSQSKLERPPELKPGIFCDKLKLKEQSGSIESHNKEIDLHSDETSSSQKINKVNFFQCDSKEKGRILEQRTAGFFSGLNSHVLNSSLRDCIQALKREYQDFLKAGGRDEYCGRGENKIKVFKVWINRIIDKSMDECKQSDKDKLTDLKKRFNEAVCLNENLVIRNLKP